MKVCVIGAGTMGNGIAHVFALKNFKVQLLDQNKDQLEKALLVIEANLNRQFKKELITQEEVAKALSNITTTVNVGDIESDTDLVVEAVSENFELKVSVLAKIVEVVSADTIIATNTSSISITKLAARLSYPERVIGMHFMNPVPLMVLVEVIRGYQTSQICCDKIVAISEKLDKKPILVNDYPGFVANRILMPMINEAIITLHEGVAGVEEIDEVMKLGMAHPMGPLQLADFIGLDVCKNILNVLYEGFGQSKYAPNPLLVNMVNAGQLGVKTGIGFYNWKNGGKNLEVSEKFLK